MRQYHTRQLIQHHNNFHRAATTISNQLIDALRKLQTSDSEGNRLS
jgi:hypothetical protein